MTYLTYPSQEEVYQLAKDDEIIAEAMEVEKVFFRTPEALLETAKNLLKLGLSIEQIKAATHLNDEQLAQLR